MNYRKPWFCPVCNSVDDCRCKNRRTLNAKEYQGGALKGQKPVKK